MARNLYAFTYIVIILLLATFGLAPTGFAQTTSTISGTILDAGTKKPVEFATVAVQDLTGKVITGATCDIEGKFAIPKVAPGAYKLAVSFIGYQTKTQDLTVPATGNLRVGNIELPLDAKSLKEVNVTAEKPTIEETDNGFVYNAEKDMNAVGGNAADLLKNVPGLSVDPDGNLEMQGTTKIRVLIDNKPSSIMAGNLAEALRQIPANMIAKVEVITTPSAKYDAEGAGGVVNIITKKNSTLQGYTGGLNINGGNRANGANGYLSTRLGKVGLNANAGGNLNRNFGNGENEQSYYERSLVTQSNEFQNNGEGFNGQIGSNIDFNDKNNLSATVRASHYSSSNDRLGTALETSTVPATFGQVRRNDRSNTDSRNASSSVDANLDYTRRFKKKDQELSLLMLYSRNANEGENYTIRRNKDEIVDNRQQSNNEASNEEIAFQVDYQHPFKKLGNVEVGSKVVMRQNQSNFQSAWARTLEAPMVTDPRRTNVFSFNQNVYSTYFNYGLRIKKKYGVQLGGRYEYTAIDADYKTTGTSVSKPFSSFMPNITVSRRIKETQRLAANYSTRVFRPQIEYLNPFADSSNIRSIRVGNSNLLPELTHNLQLTYNNNIKKSFTNINASVYWRQTNNDIGPYRTFARVVNPQALGDKDPKNDSVNSITTTWLNNGNNIAYGTNIGVNTRVKQKVQLGANLGLLYNEINGIVYSEIQKKNLAISNSGWQYNLNLNAGFRIPQNFQGPFRNFGAQITSSLSSPRFSLQGKSSAFQRYNISFRKEFLVRKSDKDRASVNFSIENFLNSGNQIKTTTYTEQFTTTNIQNFYNRVFRLGLSYNFNRMQYKAKPEQPRKTIVNDDRQKMDNAEIKEIREQKLPENNRNGNKQPAKPATNAVPPKQ